MRSSRRDPWQPFGTALYHLLNIAGRAINIEEPGGAVPRTYAEDPEPRWTFCLQCGHSTVHEPYRWMPPEGDGDVDYECTACGAVG